MNPESQEEDSFEEEEDYDRATARPYVHSKCGQITLISGNDFRRITNPFEIVPKTFCANCQAFVKLSEVAWADTQEPISLYRRRMRSTSPPPLKLLAWFIGPLACAVLGAGIGFLFPPAMVPPPIVAGALGALLAFLFLPSFLGRAWGIDNRGAK